MAEERNRRALSHFGTAAPAVELAQAGRQVSAVRRNACASPTATHACQIGKSTEVEFETERIVERQQCAGHGADEQHRQPCPEMARPRGQQGDRKRHDAGADETAGQSGQHASQRLAGIDGLPVDKDRGIHRTDEGDHGDDGGGQRRPPRIGGKPPHQNEHQHSEREPHQRDPDVAGQSTELVDHGQQQRRQDAGHDAGGGDFQEAVAG